MSKNLIIAIIVVVVLAVGGWWLYSSNMATAPTFTTQPTEQTGEVDNTAQANPMVDVEVVVAKTHEVIYTNSGYSPSQLTIKVGDTVVFKNQSTTSLWTASGMHPVHSAYSGIALQQHCPDPENNDFDQCKAEAPGASWSFTFTKAGTWGYHDHMSSMNFGKIIVE